MKVFEQLLERDGLILGVVAFEVNQIWIITIWKIAMVTEDSPTLTKNDINRHMSKIICILSASNKSPWLSEANVGDIHNVAISHGEGNLTNDAMIKQLIENGQIATQYVDLNGKPTMNGIYNPNGFTSVEKESLVQMEEF